MFSALFEQAARECAEPDAMVLSTVDADGRPSARYVLLKGVDDRGFVFYTNLESRKARALAAHPYAALTFYWPPATQVRIEGDVERVSDAEADAYFATRPRGSQIGAVGVGAERGAGVARGARRAGRGDRGRFEGAPVTRPPFWSGFRVVARRSSSGPAIPPGSTNACVFQPRSRRVDALAPLSLAPQPPNALPPSVNTGPAGHAKSKATESWSRIG